MGISSTGNSSSSRGLATFSRGVDTQGRKGASSSQAAGKKTPAPRSVVPSSAKKTPSSIDFSRSHFESARPPSAGPTRSVSSQPKAKPAQATLLPSQVKPQSPSLHFAKDTVSGAVSTFSQNVLKGIMSNVGIGSATISSTVRTPASQAQEMYRNIEETGTRAQKKLYGKYGDQVIDAYVSAKQAGMSREQTLQAMENKINELGPSNVSPHLADPTRLNVVDIAPSSIPPNKRAAFEQALRKDPNVSKFLGPSNNDPAFHVEIKQPQ